MSLTLLAFLAFSPILLAAVLLVGLRWPASRAMPLVYVLSAVIALFAWDMTINRVIASTLQGLIITAGVLWIIFGAILVLNTLKQSSGMAAILRKTIWPTLYYVIATGLLALAAAYLLGVADPLMAPAGR